MAENAETIKAFDHELRECVVAALDNGLSRQAVAGTLMAMAADFNQNKDLLASYKDAVKEDTAK